MLLPFFQWCESLWLGQFIVGSNWLFPVIEAVHLLALSVLGGAVFVVDFRLMGFGLTERSPSELWRAARPWTLGALTVMIVTGLLLFLSEPIKLYYSDAFWVKITTLAIAIVFALTVRTSVIRDAVRNTARRQLLVGALSVALWIVVAAAGRWIGFS